MKKYLKIILQFCLLLTCLYAQTGYSQKGSIKGVIKDTASSKNLEYAVIALINTKDSLLVNSTRSLQDGSFYVSNLKAAIYDVLVTYPNMADFIVSINLIERDSINLGNIIMTARYRILEEVIVKSTQAAIRMKGDTLEYKADSFAVKSGASVQDLLKRLPGIEVSKNGTIKAQGEKVTRVLVDGDEFFNDDPTLATKYLQAKAVDKIQVFNQQSDQAKFSGIDDGKRIKTINIKLKENSRNGYFGNVVAGSDLNKFYDHEGMLGKFKGKQKLAVFADAKNITLEDDNRREKFSFGEGEFDSIDDQTGGLLFNNSYNYGSYNSSAFPSILNGGVQFSDKWKNNKQQLNGNLKFNDNTGRDLFTSKNIQILPDSTILLNIGSNENRSSSNSINGAASFGVDVDSFSNIRFFSSYGNVKNNNVSNEYSESKNELTNNFLNRSNRLLSSNNTNLNANNSIVWNKRFRKKGSSFSLTFAQTSNQQNGIVQTESENFLYNAQTYIPSTETIAQQQQNGVKENSYATKMALSQKLNKQLSMQFSYAYKLTKIANGRNVFAKSINNKYEDFIDSLSNKLEATIISHLPNMVVQLNKNKFNVSVGTGLVFTKIEQEAININIANRKFVNFEPKANLSYRFSQSAQLSANYNGRTRQPSFEELQPLRDLSNPLAEFVGNPFLKPTFTHSFHMYYYKFNIKNSGNINASFSYSLSQNAITGDTRFGEFNKSKTQYVNINGNSNWYGNFGYNRNFRKLNLTLGGSINMNNSTYNSLVNGLMNTSKNADVGFRANIKYEKMDKFTLSIESGFSINTSKNSIGSFTNTQFVNNTHTIELEVFLPWKIQLMTEANINNQLGNDNFNNTVQIIRWNASLEKTITKNEQLFARLAMYDILNQNTNFGRYADGTNITESTNNVIRRFGLLSLIWKFMHTKN